MTERIDYRIDGDLKRRVLNRVGKTEGEVDINQESWDFGFCSTCSYPESGFSVHVDGELVWPAREYLDVWGGVTFADSNGYVVGRNLTIYGEFNEWLNGRSNWDEDDD